MNEKSGFHFSFTLPSLQTLDGDPSRLRKLCTAAEKAGIDSVLIYTGASSADPWVQAQLMISCTNRIIPLVAVQPLRAHPLTIASIIDGLWSVYRRKIMLNFVVGSLEREMGAFGDRLEHDLRYERLGEYMEIVLTLLSERSIRSFKGVHYRCERTKLCGPSIPDVETLIAGASDAAKLLASRFESTLIVPVSPKEDSWTGEKNAQRVGIVTAPTDQLAWEKAQRFFPDEASGEKRQQIASLITDSAWRKNVARDAQEGDTGAFWYRPFRQGQNNAPLIVGGYEKVVDTLRSLTAHRGGHIILQEICDDREFEHVAQLVAKLKITSKSEIKKEKNNEI